MKNIIVIGMPQSGKSTLLEKVVRRLPKCHGFLTREIKNGSNRIGFEMGNLIPHPKEELFHGMGIIAHVNFFDTEHRVSKYGVDTVVIDSVVGLCSKINQTRDDKLISRELTLKGQQVKPFVDERFSLDTVLYIDEIGQMQLFSEHFKKIVKNFFDSPNKCIATMTAVFEHPFIDALKSRNDTLILELAPSNRDSIEKKVLSFLL